MRKELLPLTKPGPYCCPFFLKAAPSKALRQLSHPQSRHKNLFIGKENTVRHTKLAYVLLTPALKVLWSSYGKYHW